MLSEKHERALKLFEEKFRRGAEEHGDINLSKDWTKEALDEAIDLAFYLIFLLLERVDKG